MAFWKDWGKSATSQKSKTEVTIQEIHNRFERAANTALEEAKNILAQPIPVDEEKAQLMHALGFSGTKDAKILEEDKKQKSEAEIRAKTVMKYQQIYPHLKFIFIDQVKEICEKYGLVCGTINLYKGDIPMKNLQEIEGFSLKPQHIYSRFNSSYTGIRDWSNELDNRYSSLTQPLDYVLKEYIDEPVQKVHKFAGKNAYAINDKDYNKRDNHFYPFFICAPKTDMNMENKKVAGFFVQNEVPDPIVLYPQPLDMGFLVVSKWGLEASDPIVINFKDN